MLLDKLDGITRAILSGEKGPKRDIVLLNAAFAIMAGGKTTGKNARAAIPTASSSASDPRETTASDKSSETAAAQNQRPNIVFIFADDMGSTGTSLKMIKGDASTKSVFHQNPQTALVFKHWKLLSDWDAQTCKVYNLKTDPGETTDLSEKEPVMVEMMVEVLHQRLKESKAQLPSENPNDNPAMNSSRQHTQQNGWIPQLR